MKSQAAQNGAFDRPRPIVSSTLTNLAGLLPLALSDPRWSPLCDYLRRNRRDSRGGCLNAGYLCGVDAPAGVAAK